MRIGQLLIEAELVSPKQLSSGLEYGKAKSIALGRCMKLLGFMKEEDVERALEAQKLIRMGLSPVIGIEALKKSVKEKTTLERALQGRHLDAVSTSGVAQQQIVEVDYAAPADKLIEKGDRFLLEDRCEEAEAHYLRAKTVMQRQLGQGHAELAQIYTRLGNMYMATERFDQAESCYEEVLVLRLKLPPGSPQIAEALESLADLYQARGDKQQAAENFLQALDILERRLPSGLSYYTALLRKAASVSVQNTKGKEEAVRQPIGELLKEAGLITDEQLQDALKKSKQYRVPLGTVLRNEGMITERDLQSALKSQFYVRQNVLSPQLATELLVRACRRGISLERLLHEAGVLDTDPERYEAYRQLAVELDKLVAAESNSADSQELAPAAYRVGSLYEQIGDHSQAEIFYCRALKIWGGDVRGDITAARACSALARLHLAQDRFVEAVPLLMKALEHRQHALGAGHDETLETLEDIAEAELLQGNPHGAVSFVRSVLATREGQGQEGQKLLRVVILSGDCSRQLGQYQEAEQSYMRALELAQLSFGSASPALASVVDRYADLLSEQTRSKEALRQYEYALKILKMAKKSDSDMAVKIQGKIANLAPAPAQS